MEYISKVSFYIKVEAGSSLEADCIIEDIVKGIREIAGCEVPGWDYPKATEEAEEDDR